MPPLPAGDATSDEDEDLRDKVTYLTPSHLNKRIYPRNVDHVFLKDIKLGKTEYQNSEVIIATN